MEGGAEGIMCAINSLNGIPSCVDPLLHEKLRNEWNSSCFIQTDCCDSIDAMVSSHHYFKTLEEAVTASMNIGVQASYGNPKGISGLS
jgi:beta-glucosidase-like glycosyl hydrolase